MKKLIIILGAIFLACLLTILILLVILLVLSVSKAQGQEGCGEWVYLRQTEIRSDCWGTKYIYEADVDFLNRVWIKKPCPDDMRILDQLPHKYEPWQLQSDTLIETEKRTHVVFEVCDEEPCNPGDWFKLYCPIAKLDSIVVRENDCHEDYWLPGIDNHVLGYFPCYSFILDRVKYWIKENPLPYLEEK